MKNSFFAGTVTPDGFVSCFKELFDESYKVFILKGGPGTGKSTIMKKIVSKLDECDIDCELFFCSSDIESLDAVKIPSKKIVILDGTSPHTLDPEYPGVCERIINLGENFDLDLLKSRREEIISLTDENKKIHKQIGRYISAAGNLNEDTLSVGLITAKLSAANEYAMLFAEKHIPKGKAPAKETKRFLSAVTYNGITTLDGLCGIKNVFVCDDKIGAVSSLIISNVKSIALSRGFDVISLMNPFVSGKTEHIIIPKLSLAVLNSGNLVKIKTKNKKIIRTDKFYDEEKLSHFCQRIVFNHKAAKRLIMNASALLKEANDLHIRLEKCYIDATNFSKTNAVCEKMISEIMQ